MRLGARGSAHLGANPLGHVDQPRCGGDQVERGGQGRLPHVLDVHLKDRKVEVRVELKSILKQTDHTISSFLIESGLRKESQNKDVVEISSIIL